MCVVMNETELDARARARTHTHTHTHTHGDVAVQKHACRQDGRDTGLDNGFRRVQGIAHEFTPFVAES